MRIVLVAATEQPICPYCHDDLAPPTKTCASCGTAYHVDCSRLAGRCALLGCGGALAAVATGEARLALVLVAPTEPTAAQEDALLAAVGFTRWDAQQRLKARVPTIVAWFDRDKIEHVLQALEAAKLQVFAIDARALVVRAPFVVRSIQREDDRLLLESTLHQKRVLALATPRFVVRGRFALVSEKKRTDLPARDQAVTRVTRSRDLYRFVHVWFEGETTPLVFEQNELRDFAFLGDKKSASGFENMVALGDLLALGQPCDSSLEPLGDSHVSATGAAPGQGTVSTNRHWVLSTSRLLAHAWLAGASKP